MHFGTEEGPEPFRSNGSDVMVFQRPPDTPRRLILPAEPNFIVLDTKNREPHHGFTGCPRKEFAENKVALERGPAIQVPVRRLGWHLAAGRNSGPMPGITRGPPFAPSASQRAFLPDLAIPLDNRLTPYTQRHPLVFPSR